MDNLAKLGYLRNPFSRRSIVFSTGERCIRHQGMHQLGTRGQAQMTQPETSFGSQPCSTRGDAGQYNPKRPHQISASFYRLRLLQQGRTRQGARIQTLFIRVRRDRPGVKTQDQAQPLAHRRRYWQHSGLGCSTQGCCSTALAWTPERCGVPGCKAAVHINKLNTAASTEHKCRQKTLHRPASTTAAYSTAPAASCQAAPFDPPIKQSALQSPLAPVSISHKHLYVRRL